MPKFARPNSYNGKQSNKNWTGQTRAANAAEAAAGDSEQLYISPATLASAVGGLVPSATTLIEGVVLLTDNNSPVATKFYADSLAIAGAPAWSETISGIGQLATTAEAQAASNDNVAMTPLKTSQLLATPPAIGGTTPAAGAFTTLAASGLSSLSGSATILTAGTALNLASDADTAAVNIGTGAGARTITLGNVTGATAVAVNTGTGHFTVTTTGSGDIILNSDDTMLLDADGVLELNSSGGVISIGNDADAQNINVGTGAAARVITIGNSTGATQVVVNGGTAGINIGANAIAQTVTIGNQTGASAVVIDAGTGPINIGTTIAKVITIGNLTGASGTAINVGTGNFVLDGVTNSTYGIGASTTTGSITIGGTAQTGDLVLGSSSGTNAVKIMNGAGAGTLSLGVVQTAGAINMGTAMTTGTITVGGTGAHTGTIGIAPGTGAQTINIANNTGIKTINIAGDSATSANIIKIGTGAGAQTCTLGSTNTTSTTTINSGSGNVNVTGGNLVITTTGKGLQVKGGVVTDMCGTGVLTAGTQTIANTNIATGDLIFLSRIGVETSSAVGVLTYTISNGASFTVTSKDVSDASTLIADVSTYAYFIVRPV